MTASRRSPPTAGGAGTRRGPGERAACGGGNDGRWIQPRGGGHGLREAPGGGEVGHEKKVRKIAFSEIHREVKGAGETGAGPRETETDTDSTGRD